MTREEAIKEFYEILELGAVDYQKGGLITRIYNDFESRTCDNCKHWNSHIKTPSKGICSKLGVHNIGGCGDYFERKKK